MQKIGFKDARALVISPHPDDEVIGCGGTISRIVNEGGEVFVLFGAVGKCRQLVTGQTDENVRLKETKKVSKKAGYRYKFMFVGDEFMHLDSIPRKRLIDPIEDCVAELKPDIVFIPFRNSYDQDHVAMFNAAITALRPRPQKVRHFVPIVLEYEEPYCWGSDDSFVPNFYVDISKFLVKKIELLKLHATQCRKDPFARSAENLVRLAGLHGTAVGVEAAEAFRLLRCYL